MKTLFEVCEPREDVRRGRTKEGEFAADLARVLRGDAAPEYGDAATFFANTHPTRGLRALLDSVMRRVAGKGGEASPIFRLDTSYGGGKTHALIALTHAARSGMKVPNIAEFVDPGLLPRAAVQVAAFDGENADPLNGRKLADGVQAFTPWGELAFALGGPAGYEKVRRSDEARVAPGAETLRTLFDNRPTLILLDELSIYLRKVTKRPDKDQLAPFLTSLFTAVESSPGAAIVFTLAVGKNKKALDAYATENEAVAKLLDEIESIAARKATLLDPTGEETAQVLRRRLFSRIDQSGAEQIANAYEALWKANQSSLPKLRLREDRGAAIRSGYPFHPELISVLTDKVATLANFQRVRGMLRLLAETVAQLWAERPSATYAIHPHHIDPGYEPIKREIVTRLELSSLEPAIRNDVSAAATGVSSIAQQIDAEKFAGLPPYASQVARTILWHTLALNEQIKGANAEDVRYAVLAPGTDISFIEDARQRFVASSEYLDDRPGVNHRFLTDANLKRYIRRLEQQEIDPGTLRADLNARIVSAFVGKALNLRAFPGGPVDVEDGPSERPLLIVPSYDAATISPEALRIPDLVEKIFKYQGSQGAHRQFINNLVFLVADEQGREEMKARAATRMALHTLKQSHRYTELRDHQRRWLDEEIGKTETALAVAIQSCYRHLFFPSRSHAVEGAAVPLAHASIETHAAAERPGEGQQQVLKTLREAEKTVASGDDPPSPRFVRDRSPALIRGPLSTADLRAEFRRNPGLWMLLGDDPFVALVRTGIQEKVFVYQSGELLVGPGDPPAEVKIDAQSLLITMEYATEHGIWPRRPKDEPGEKRISTAGNAPAPGSATPGPANTGTDGGAIVSIFEGAAGRRPFEHEGPLKEALSRIWEMALRSRVSRIVRLDLTIFNASDAFRLLTTVSGLGAVDRTVQLKASYETADSSSVSIEFNGTPADAEHVKEHLEPQFRAAKESNLEATFTLVYKDGLRLDGRDHHSLTEKLTRFASESALVKAYAEATFQQKAEAV